MAVYRPSPIMPLETERLLLRPVQESDAERVQILFPTPNVVRYLVATIPWPYPADGAITFLRDLLPKVAAQEIYTWAILRKGQEDEGLIGMITLDPLSDQDNRGFWLGEAYWGQGYMTEAATVVTDFAFDVLAMESLLLTAAEPNAASQRLKESACATEVAREEVEYRGGKFVGIKWRLTRDAWKARPGGPRGGENPEPVA